MNLTPDVIFVIGNKGTGKSTLLNEIHSHLYEGEGRIEDPFVVGDQGTHVTQRQKSMPITRHNGEVVILVDSVGWDMNKKNLTSLREFDGKRICLIFLNNDYRLTESKKQICKMFGDIAESNVNIFNAWFLHADLAKLWNVGNYDQIIHDLNGHNLLSFPYVSPFRQREVQDPVAPSTSSMANIPRHPYTACYSATREDNYFANVLKKLIRGNKISVEKVKENRIPGDYRHKLNMHYLCENEEQFGQMITNKNMSDFLRSRYPECEDDIRTKIYEMTEEGPPLSEEKIADVYEALVEITFKKELKGYSGELHNLLFSELIEYVRSSSV
eukprot:g8173.t1